MSQLSHTVIASDSPKKTYIGFARLSGKNEHLLVHESHYFAVIAIVEGEVETWIADGSQIGADRNITEHVLSYYRENGESTPSAIFMLSPHWDRIAP